MSNRWQLQQAKARLSEVVDRALADGPQVITRHGNDAVVVVSVTEYEKTRPKGTLVDFFRNSPLWGVELQIERSKDLPRPGPDLE